MDKMTPTINEFANYYEFRGDYDHTPTDGERTMIEDAITGYLEDTGLAQALTTLQGERDRLREAGDALAEAAYLHMGTHPVFRMKPTGFEGSRARLQQEDQIATENTLMAAVKEWKSNDPL